MNAPDFWSDQETAQKKSRELASLKEEIEQWDHLVLEATDLAELLEIAEADEDKETLSILREEINSLATELEKREFRLALSGKYDRGGAILAIHAGAGGTEAQDWAQMLLRMYTRWAEKHHYNVDMTDMTPGEEAGIKSVTLEISGPWAYGYLKAERGVHRLVRISPFDASRRRHTSFALVEVMPAIEKDIDVEIDPKDLRVDVFRSSGPGGQHMQKNSTAIRITHLPTNIVVQSQSERSQLQNREAAMRVLRGKLFAIEQEKQEQEAARLKGKHVAAGWGNQIRSYVLQPYQMVKDLRTGYEVGNPQIVLDGDLDSFIDAWLKKQIGGTSAG